MTDKQKVKAYENLFWRIHYARTAMSASAVTKELDLISGWCHAHSGSNGENSPGQTYRAIESYVNAMERTR